MARPSRTSQSTVAGMSDRPKFPQIGLALAGGASEGAIYEIGALRALDEAIGKDDLRDFGVFVGVSAGGFLSSCLANGLSSAQMCRAIVKREPGEHPFVPEIFFQPAVGEIARRLVSTPKWLGSALWSYVSRREQRLVDSLTVLARTLPVGVFNNEPIREYVDKIFQKPGRTDDFRQLKRSLVVVATDLESGESIRFGRPGWQHVPISTAVQATTALPGLYPPVEIDGRLYVDGILRKTMHASVALEAGAKLVFCINPIVPVDTRQAVQQNILQSGDVVRGGLPSVMSQAVRTLIHSRMVLGLRAYENRYPDADVVLLEPPRNDHENFFSNIFSFSSRRDVCERAYQATRRSLLRRYDELTPTLAEHGLELDLDVLRDQDRDLWTSVGLPELSTRNASERRKPIAKHRPPSSERVSSREILDDLDGLLVKLEKMVAEQRASS